MLAAGISALKGAVAEFVAIEPVFPPEHCLGQFEKAADGPLNDAVFGACKGKTSQCGDLDEPALVAVVTFHALAAMICFNRLHANMLLTGETMVSWNVDTQTGEQVGSLYQSTELRSATFLKPDRTNGIGFARSSISGILLCGFGIHPPRAMSLSFLGNQLLADFEGEMNRFLGL